MSHDHDHDHDHTAHAADPVRATPGPVDGPAAGHDHGHGGHDHGHAHAGPDTAEWRLQATLVVSALYMLVEAIGGWWTGSLALLADAGHMLSDAGALVLVLFALRIARRPADPRRTYGYHRAEVLAAVANGATLIAIGVGVAWEGIERWMAPPAVNGAGMLGIAAGGLLVNLVSLAILSGGRNAGLNLRGAWLHVLGDALGSVGAMVAGVLVWKLGWSVADPIVSLVISLLIVHSAWGLLKEATAVLMESAPTHLDVSTIRSAILAIPGVASVHDLHVWTIASGKISMSGHVVVSLECVPASVLSGLAGMLRERFGIVHTTIQVEPPGFVEDDGDLHP